MKPTFFFYDLETSGVDSRNARIMQYAGQRMDMDLKPIGDPSNHLIRMTDDTLPEPDAIMITGITPQQTIQDGISEAEFVQIFDKEINQPGTIFAGFNSIRFDDEFMRFLFYRNFYDSYQWQWKDGNSRWDLLDVVRMTRALRPDGIKWPFASDGKPTNRLEMLTDLNKLSHDDAHDALSDVRATIAVAEMIKSKQPKLFNFLLSMRDKKVVKHLVESEDIFVYVSGKYDAAYEKLAVVHRIGDHPDRGGSLVYDLRHNPEQYLKMSPERLAEAWKYKKDSDEPRLPVKTLRYNRCPAIAPTTVLSDENKSRLKIDLAEHQSHRKILEENPKFYQNIIKALELMDNDRSEQIELLGDTRSIDTKLYDGFISDRDKTKTEKVRNSPPENLDTDNFTFDDPRLTLLLPLYKARNYPKKLSSSEREEWELFRKTRINAQLPKFGDRLEKLSADPKLSDEKKYLLEEIKLYAQSLLD